MILIVLLRVIISSWWPLVFEQDPYRRNANELLECGAPMYERNGLIRSREFPSRITYGDCLWDIHPKNKSVLLHFEHLNLPESDGCRDFYAAVGDSSGVEPELICGAREPFDVLVQAKKVLLLSHAERDIHGDRIGFQLHYMTLNHSVSEAERKASWVITASNVASSTAEITWSHYSAGAGETLVLYAIVCTPTLHEAGPSITTVVKDIDNSTAERLQPYTDYTAQVIALVKSEVGEMSFKGSEEVSFTTKEGGKMNAVCLKKFGIDQAVEGEVCGDDMEADAGQIMSPEYPGTPYIGHDQWDENPKCYWNIAPNGQLRMYFPGISENDENHATDLCGHIPENFTMLVIDKVLNLRASGFGYQRYAEEYRNGTKFLIDYEAVKGEITTVTGKV
ncbi:hypothetical protein pdam_00017678 [Pocillopora damicornis]|uniref:CUB domain-containing protein n=1 Tax=Pocillopora damicornis TaxID=46731 RepID=A0A3M6TBM2_POCDA|nr:hypothetical protein pdam_00017678 [Pocillopora damicornis]